MTKTTADVVEDLKDKVEELKIVSKLYLYGSRATAKNQANSDFDFLVEFKEKDQNLEKYHELNNLIDENIGIYTWDLVDKSKADSEFLERIESDLILIYDENDK